MGDVAVVYRVMPEGVETNIAELKKKISEIKIDTLKVYSIREKPIAFGLKALEVQIITPDRGGAAEAFEKAVSKIPGVVGIEITETGLV